VRALAAVLMLCACGARSPTSTTERADLVLTDARVFTGDAKQPWTTAVAIRKGRIVALGADATRMVARCKRALGGKLVIPGINDAHVHEPSLFDAVEVESVAGLAAAASANPPGTWLHAPLDVDDPNITRDALDQVAPSHPVWLDNSTGHVVVLNSAAEKLLDLTALPPLGGFIERPGWRSEYARYAAMRARGRNATDAEIEAAVRKFEDAALAYGITTAQTFPLDIDADRLAKVLQASPRRLRWHVRWVPIGGVRSPMVDPPPIDPDARVTLAGTKYFLDGTQVERGAAITQPYADKPTTGRLDWILSNVRRMFEFSRDRKDALHLHAVGDRAIHQIIDAMTGLGGVWKETRVVLEHGDGIVPADFQRLRELGIVVVQNPYHADPSLPNKARLGDRPWMLLRSILAAGIPLAFGSDGPLDPFENIARAEAHGNESLTREQSLLAYTAGSAYVERLEATKGKVAPGMVADLAVLSADLFTATSLAGIHSELTIVGGNIVYGTPCPR